MSKEFEELVLKKLDNNERMIQDVVNKLDDTDRTVQEVVKKLEDTDIIVQELSAEFKDLNNKFTVFDYEINKKIDTLFDAYKVNKEKDSFHEKEIASLNAKVFNQDIRISNLEDKVLIA